jgi:hypothetical protein
MRDWTIRKRKKFKRLQSAKFINQFTQEFEAKVTVSKIFFD